MSLRFLALAAFALGVGAAPALVACGEQKMERGLAPAQEPSTPQSPAEERMTEEQRRQLEAMEEEGAAQRDFEGGEEETAAGQAD